LIKFSAPLFLRPPCLKDIAGGLPRAFWCAPRDRVTRKPERIDDLLDERRNPGRNNIVAVRKDIRARTTEVPESTA
jgi:hypothetical protein